MWARVMAEFSEDRLSFTYCFTLAGDKKRTHYHIVTTLADTIAEATAADGNTNTFTGEGRGRFVLLLGLFCGFGRLVFEHQVLWHG